MDVVIIPESLIRLLGGEGERLQAQILETNVRKLSLNKDGRLETKALVLETSKYYPEISKNAIVAVDLHTEGWVLTREEYKKIANK